MTAHRRPPIRFSDAPRGHPAFKYIETLYDYSTQSQEPFFDYEIDKGPGESARVLVRPDQEISGGDAAKIISGLLQMRMPAGPDPNAKLSRGEAAQMIYRSLGDKMK